MQLTTHPKIHTVPKSIKELDKIVSEAKTRIETDGFFKFQAGSTDQSTLIKFADCFGKRQGHVLADQEGIHEVSTNSSHKKVPIDKQKYIGLTNEEHKPHTDAT